MNNESALSVKEISWPETEEIPTCFRAAFRSGWEFDSAKLYDIDRLKEQAGNEQGDVWFCVMLRKETDQFILSVGIEISAGIMFEGPPTYVRTPRAYEKQSKCRSRHSQSKNPARA